MKLARPLQCLRVIVVIAAVLFAVTSVIRAQVYDKVFSFSDARVEEFADAINKGSDAASLVQGSDGNFYGTTSGGGALAHL